MQLKLILYFLGFEGMALRQYDRLTNSIKPNFESYEKMKELLLVFF